MARALVTGGTGFVGSNLIEHLRQLGWEVNCLVRDKSRAEHLEALGGNLIAGDLFDAEALRRAVDGCDVVFHVAGRVHALNDQEFERDNVEGTRLLAEVCADQDNPPTFIYVSSLAAGGPNRPGEPRREQDEDRPVSAYGESKLAAERAAASFAPELPLSIVRPPIIFGQRDKSSLKIFSGVKFTRMHAVPGLRRFPVSLVHVSDLCDALVKVAENGQRVTQTSNGKPQRKDATYYVAAERVVGYGELGHLAAQALDRNALAIYLPKFLMWLAGGFVEVVGQLRGSPGLLNLDKLREATSPAWECSDEKIRTELGYQPAATLEQRFAETAQWYRQAGWL